MNSNERVPVVSKEVLVPFILITSLFALCLETFPYCETCPLGVQSSVPPSLQNSSQSPLLNFRLCSAVWFSIYELHEYFQTSFSPNLMRMTPRIIMPITVNVKILAIIIANESIAIP